MQTVDCRGAVGKESGEDVRYACDVVLSEGGEMEGGGGEVKTKDDCNPTILRAMEKDGSL